MPNVLILGGRAPVAADHARRFAHQGWTVYIADSIPCRISGWSYAVRATIRLAPPRFDPAAFIAGLSRAIKTYSIDLIIPTCEEVFFLSRYRSALPTSCRVAADDFDKLRMLHSKWDFQNLARECGGNAPVSAVVRTLAEAREWANGAPIVLKPEFSRFGVHVQLYPSGIPANAPELAEQGRWVAQRYCQGRELCSYSIADKGRLLAHAVYLPKYRLQLSASYYFDHYVSPAIYEFAEAFVDRLQFTGQISFDWIDAGDGQPAVIECNPRAISGLHLFSMQDAVPSALTGEATACTVPSKIRAGMIAPIMLTSGLAHALGSGGLSEWLHDYRRADDVITADRDYGTVIGATADIGSYLRMALRQRCTMREAATRDIEWDGELLSQV